MSHVAHADLELTIWLRVALNFVGSGITSVQQIQVLSLLSEGSTGTPPAFPWASGLLLVTIHTKDPFQFVSTPPLCDTKLLLAPAGSVLVILNGEREHSFMMRTSPRRPLILKRRRLPLPVQNAPGETAEEEAKRAPAQQEPTQAQASQEVAESSSCKFPAGIKIINHPTMPNTQVVAIPNNADIQSIITALTAKGKESGSSGPNKFILISSGGTSSHPPGPQPQAQTSHDSKRTEASTETLGPKPAAKGVPVPKPPGALPRQRQETCGMWFIRQRGVKAGLSPPRLQSVELMNVLDRNLGGATAKARFSLS